jgi:hypothetical protein
MSEERPLIEEVLDYAVFAPLGLALTVAEDLPGLVARGRRQVEGQFGIARFVGKMALRQVRSRIDGLLATEPSSEAEEPAPERTVIDATPAPPPPPANSGDGEELAIPGYDSLAASQVVARLDSLELDELHAIRRYEERTRRRQTILTKIAQLEGARGH